MAKRSAPQNKSRTPGSRKNLTLVSLAGLLLVVWGFVLGVLVGRGTMPTLIPDQTAQVNEKNETSRTSLTEKAVTTTQVSTTSTTETTSPQPTTTYGFFSNLPENVSETLPPLPPPTTTAKAPSGHKKPSKSPSVAKSAAEPPKNKPEKPQKEKPVQKEKPGVKITESKPLKKELPAKKAEPKSAPKYSLQVAALVTMEEARQEAARVAKKTKFKVRIVVSEIKGKTWYRVRVGGFATKTEARAASRHLKAAGLESILVRAIP